MALRGGMEGGGAHREGNLAGGLVIVCAHSVAIVQLSLVQRPHLHDGRCCVLWCGCWHATPGPCASNPVC